MPSRNINENRLWRLLVKRWKIKKQANPTIDAAYPRALRAAVSCVDKASSCCTWPHSGWKAGASDRLSGTSTVQSAPASRSMTPRLMTISPVSCEERVPVVVEVQRRSEAEDAWVAVHLSSTDERIRRLSGRQGLDMYSSFYGLCV